jgi:hypothetical protein
MEHVGSTVEHVRLSVAHPGCQQVPALLPDRRDFVAPAAHNQQHRLLDARRFRRAENPLADAVVTSATGCSRTVTVELLLMPSLSS